jgi:Flp pilus assembly CpaF family ATPase
MKDRTAEDVVVNPDGRVWIMRQGKPFEVLTEISPLRAVGATMSIAEGFGLVATHNSPVVSGNVPYLNCRVEALVAPVVPIASRKYCCTRRGSTFGNGKGMVCSSRNERLVEIAQCSIAPMS